MLERSMDSRMAYVSFVPQLEGKGMPQVSLREV